MDQYKKEFIDLVKESKPTPPAGAMERCISSLPNVERKQRFIPLLKLQMESLPVSLYLLMVMGILLEYAAFWRQNSLEAIRGCGVIHALIVLLFFWHLLLSGVGSMREIEKVCKYSYGQILLARVLCLVLLSFAAQMIVILPNAIWYQVSLQQIIASLFPTMLGALGALYWANHIGSSDTTLLSIYLVNAVIASVFLEQFIELGWFLMTILFFLVITMHKLQTKNLINRSIQYETYNY